MSSITTAIPTDPIPEWCIGPLQYYDGDKYQCANSTKGTEESDFQTFCCDGEIINSVHDIWKPAFYSATNHSLSLSDMICCGLSGPQAGGILPLPSAYTECNGGSPTPLASLANTNTENAQLFRVTYTSASFGDNTVGDFIPTNTPNCFWAYTSGAATAEITLPTPDITTLAPESTNAFGEPITTTRHTSKSSASEAGSSSSGPITAAPSSTPSATVLSGTASQSSSESSASAIPTTSDAGSVYTGVQRGYLYVGLGLATMSLLCS
ncbi:uncharacterized protein F4807DRAFT_284368 [Annulohypoxylon truncatum]|uniref:uncharacterized protein n=1 Tax=Annulohypoxylon truncatum TaxID=327061 RepID=UPI002007419E|nr:uncharacterized protein F4807DRAFT_284368 [Annulohypoxylon truncatum]KAI1205404.1 hypothetical protein F4807DRAFT_284368 [Annulohypoxylon truncatum]